MGEQGVLGASHKLLRSESADTQLSHEPVQLEEQPVEQSYFEMDGLPDPDLERQVKCLPELTDPKCSGKDCLEKDKVCSDDASNKVKDDNGNYIRYTRAEDKISIKIWELVMAACKAGKTYLRDVVLGFASGKSCFLKGKEDKCSVEE